MDLACLNIRQEYARLNVHSTFNVLSLRNASRQPEMSVSSRAPVLDMSRKEGGFTIDSYPSRYARGQKSVTDFSRDNAAAGMEALKALASKITQNSYQIQDGVGKKIIPNLAYSNSKITEPPFRVTLKYVPKPEISYTPTEVRISYQPGEKQFNFKTTKVENNTHRAPVDISLAQRESIRMWVTQGKFDVYA